VKGKAISLLVLIVLVALLPGAVSAEGSEIDKGVFPANGLLSFPVDCSISGGHVVYLWLHEGPPPFGGDDDFLLEGIMIRPAGKSKVSEVWNYKAEGALASVWSLDDLAGFCHNGEFDAWGFAAFFRSAEGAYLWEVAEQDTVSVKWNGMSTDRQYRDVLTATGQDLTFVSTILWQVRDGLPVKVQDTSHLVWH
jgi:hypothetical protein